MSPRRPRGSLQDPVQTGYRVERADKVRFDSIAKQSGLSPSQLFEEILVHMPLTSRGTPTWLPEPEPKDGELPIDSA